MGGWQELADIQRASVPGHEWLLQMTEEGEETMVVLTMGGTGRRGGHVGRTATQRQMKQGGGGLVAKINAWLNERALSAFYRDGEAVEGGGEAGARPAAINGAISMET
jgi:hypothetical protein